MKSTLHALNDKRFLCSTCVAEPRKEVLEQKKAIFACTKESEKPVHKIKDDTVTYNFTRCVGNYFSHQALSWLNVFNAYEKGCMPYLGGYQDQPNKALEIIHIIEGSKNTESIKRMEEQKRKVASRGRRGR